LREFDGKSRLIPLVGTAGSAGFLPVLLWRLYTREPEVFGTVIVISVVVVVAELLYFERGVIEEKVPEVEPTEDE
ncbi:MAG: amino acid transporter, partial [Halobacteria archaeon]|nr:amino acid transporter [Halobacteria archaeon]